MADLKVTKFVIDGQNYVIPDAADGQKGLMSGEDFNKLAGITAGAEPNKIEQIKLNGAAVQIAQKAVDILITAGETNGSIKVGAAEVFVKGLAALAYKAKISQEDLDTALDAVIKAKAEQTSVDEINSTLSTLQGDGTTGSIKKMISDAINSFASDVNNNGKIDKIAEVLKWFNDVDEDGSGKELIADVQALKAILTGIGGTSEPATVQAYVEQELQKLNLSQYVTTENLTKALENKVDKVPGKELSTNDFTTPLLQKLNGIADGATKNTVSYDSATQTLTLTGFSAAE